MDTEIDYHDSPKIPDGITLIFAAIAIGGGIIGFLLGLLVSLFL